MLKITTLLEKLISKRLEVGDSEIDRFVVGSDNVKHAKK